MKQRHPSIRSTVYVSLSFGGQRFDSFGAALVMQATKTAASSGTTQTARSMAVIGERVWRSMCSYGRVLHLNDLGVWGLTLVVQECMRQLAT